MGIKNRYRRDNPHLYKFTILCIIQSFLIIFNFCFIFLTYIWARKFKIRDIWVTECLKPRWDRDFISWYLKNEQDTIYFFLPIYGDNLAPKNPRSRFLLYSATLPFPFSNIFWIQIQNKQNSDNMFIVLHSMHYIHYNQYNHYI